MEIQLEFADQDRVHFITEQSLQTGIMTAAQMTGGHPLGVSVSFLGMLIGDLFARDEVAAKMLIDAFSQYQSHDDKEKIVPVIEEAMNRLIAAHKRGGETVQ